MVSFQICSLNGNAMYFCSTVARSSWLPLSGPDLYVRCAPFQTQRLPVGLHKSSGYSDGFLSQTGCLNVLLFRRLALGEFKSFLHHLSLV